MLDNNTVYFLNIIWTYCTCMYYVSEINEYYYIIIMYMYRSYFCNVYVCVRIVYRTLNKRSLLDFPRLMIFPQ